jgi:phosphatidylinositol alpha-1,6-mannosyltransferase
LARLVVSGSAALIANSHSTARLLIEQWGARSSAVSIIHPGVDTSQFRPAPRDPAVRERLGWGDRAVVLTVGRLQKRKGHDQMIRALLTVRQAIPDILYAIIGDGEERPALRALVDREGLSQQVVFLGECDDRDLITYYQQCDLFVLPNRQVGQDIEGFGIVLLEAQACGRPVVAGASGGTAETMSEPYTGRVVDCRTSDVLAATVVDLLSNRERLGRMGAAAREWVARFDWATLGRQAQALFERPGLARRAARAAMGPMRRGQGAVRAARPVAPALHP